MPCIITTWTSFPGSFLFDIKPRRRNRDDHANEFGRNGVASEKVERNGRSTFLRKFRIVNEFSADATLSKLSKLDQLEPEHKICQFKRCPRDLCGARGYWDTEGKRLMKNSLFKRTKT